MISILTRRKSPVRDNLDRHLLSGLLTQPFVPCIRITTRDLPLDLIDSDAPRPYFRSWFDLWKQGGNLRPPKSIRMYHHRFCVKGPFKTPTIKNGKR
jgi:hypothetical protein